ncbi:hypothetical protein [Oscillibacter sp.]|uniref:hypothetical protein n=1 Tax=Oscillibacter sp. TaxID=1945593 RepID=UPI0025875A57|nr:hypothetical protein [Oscillibacter sp.]
MKHFRHLALSVLLALSLMTTALASEVPVSLVVENLNGQQRIVKTYELPPGTDPETLKEPSFTYDGFTYTWAYTTKDEHTFLETKAVTETVTVETGKKDLNTVLEQLAPSIPYDDGEFSGELALDHTTITTEAAGYATKSGKVTATKTIGPLDRNDMSYVPATTVKDGKTLTLANVEWQVIGTDLVGDVLAPSSYQAVATYSASTSYQVATGYVSTAEYKGTVTASGVDTITYTVVYVGTEIVPETPQPTEPVRSQGGSLFGGNAAAIIGPLFIILLLAALAGGGAYLYLHRKNVYIYVPGDRPRDYRLIAKYRVEPQRPEVDITGLDPYPESIVAVEIKRPLAKKLLGQTFTVHHRSADYAYTVLQDRPGDWHEFDPSEEKEEPT